MADLTGQHFGLLTALKPLEERRQGCVIWRCGNTEYVKTQYFEGLQYEMLQRKGKCRPTVELAKSGIHFGQQDRDRKPGERW